MPSQENGGACDCGRMATHADCGRMATHADCGRSGTRRITRLGPMQCQAHGNGWLLLATVTGRRWAEGYEARESSRFSSSESRSVTNPASSV